MRKFEAKVKQYGLKNSFVRILKLILRKTGITFEKFIVMKKNLDNKVIPIEPQIDVNIRELNLQDFECASHFCFLKEKLSTFRKRLGDTNYKALGAFSDGRLIYFCWLSLDIVETFVKQDDIIVLNKDEGLLLDAYTHRDYRGLGIHTYMNAVRLNTLIDLGRKTAVVLILSENIPAIKSQAKVGFSAKYLVFYTEAFRKVSIRKKEV